MENKKIAFLSEMGFTGKVSDTFENARTEYAWMNALDAIHIPLSKFDEISGFDLIIIIWPKGDVTLNAVGCELKESKNNFLDYILPLNVVETLKEKNSLVAYMQEGPCWFFNEYSIHNQIMYYNQIANSDIIFCHNEYDVKFYKGLYPGKKVITLPTLMIDTLINDITPIKENKTIIGGNFAHWYGGFQSYMIGLEFGHPIYIPSMHNKRVNEDSLDNLNHLPYMTWLEWMKNLSTFKYAVHLMPTIAAGTFSLNCAFFGIPCIGNANVDTQRVCHPLLSVEPDDIQRARELAFKLKTDQSFYTNCSEYSKMAYNQWYKKNSFLNHFNKQVFSN